MPVLNRLSIVGNVWKGPEKVSGSFGKVSDLVFIWFLLHSFSSCFRTSGYTSSTTVKLQLHKDLFNVATSTKRVQPQQVANMNQYQS